MPKNFNILIVGDIHAKSKFILPRINQAIEAYNINKVIFMGDYYDELGVEDDFIYDGIGRLVEWKSDVNNNGIETVFLCGNHDYSYFNPIAGPCSDHRDEFTESARKILIDNLEIQLADSVNDYLLTHAGVNMSWANNFMRDVASTKNPQKIADKLNELFVEAKKDAKEIVSRPRDEWLHYMDNKEISLDYLGYCGMFRGGRHPYSGPLWTDAQELLFDHLLGVNQIVAHTALRTCVREKELNPNFNVVKIWFCDANAITRHLKTGGDGSMLLVEGEKEPRIIGTKEDKNISPYHVKFNKEDLLSEYWKYLEEK